MTKYIEYEKALAFPFANGNYNSKNAISIFIQGCESYKEYLESIPAADVRPVVRGEWIGVDCSYWRHAVWGAYLVNRIRYKCSVCGRLENQKEPFCNCGADMREERDNG